VVPEVSGIDKVFDYLVPESLVPRVGRGTRVRIDLNGRRVGGWIVEIGSADERTDVQVDINRLVPIVSVSGDGVEPDVVSLTQWMSQQWFGSWRATLSSASAPRMRGRHVNPRRGQNPTFPNDEVTTATRELVSRGGGVLMVPPLASALHVVAELARDGSVLVVCPTQRMAVMGAAALRRRGFTTALVPDDWDAAKSGVDIVIGARSAVLAPCQSLSLMSMTSYIMKNVRQRGMHRTLLGNVHGVQMFRAYLLLRFHRLLHCARTLILFVFHKGSLSGPRSAL
jgi:primosomal protein N' (replication factor Y)